MSTNRNLLKEAIADAKTVKETAIANAKAVLEESFAPQLKSIISLKLQEMAIDEEDESLEEAGFGKFRAEGDVGQSNMFEKALDEEEDGEYMEEDLDLNELFGELNEEKEEEEEETEEESEEEESEDEEGEPIDLEDFTDEDLKKMIEDVITDMMKSGELEMGAEEDEVGDEEEMEMSDEEEINLEELLREIDELDEYELEDEGMMYEDEDETMEEGFNIFRKKDKSAGSAYLKKFEEANQDRIEQIRSIEDLDQRRKEAEKLVMDWIRYAAKNDYEYRFDIGVLYNDLGLKDVRGGKTDSIVVPEVLQSELEEAYATIKTLRQDLNEVNLLNAKLLYTNKIFKSKNLNENQKVKVLSSFDKATTVGEVKLVFETLNEGLKVKATKLNENLGSASKVLSAPKKQPIVESNDMVARFQKLAGII